MSHQTDSPEERIVYGFGAHVDPQTAALRAVCELNMTLPEFHFQDLDDSAVRDSLLGQWLREAKIADHACMAPDPGAGFRRMTDYAVPDTEDVRDDIEYCRGLVDERGLEFLVLDQTRPDIGMPVARVIVPGLRHYWRRLAPGRLDNVPVEMGWAEAPLAEADLNPFTIGF